VHSRLPREPRIPGSFRIANQQREVLDVYGDPMAGMCGHRVRRILESIQRDVGAGGTARVRQILQSPRELYRIELEIPDMAYQRTTVLDRDALEVLLEETPEEVVRDRFIFRS